MFLDYIGPSYHGGGSVGEFPLRPPGKSACLKVARSPCLALSVPVNDILLRENGEYRNTAAAARATSMWKVSGRRELRATRRTAEISSASRCRRNRAGSKAARQFSSGRRRRPL